MKRIVATLTWGLLASAAASTGALAEAPATAVAPPAAASGVAAGGEAKPVSPEITGSLPEAAPAAEGEGHAAPAAEGHASEGGKEGAAEAVAEPVGPPPTRPPMPFDIIRTLQFLQDQVARGNGRAIRVQSMLLRHFAPGFLAVEPSAWEDPRNRRAAILFALSGGPPEVLRQLIAANAFDEATKPLAEAALAYVLNDAKRAEKQLGALRLDGMEPGLAAHIHLVLGQLMQTDKVAEAIAHLDQARLLAPGGLIEEAALRLEVVLIDKVGDHERADALARQYFDRFPKSSYAGNFLARFAMVYDDRGAEDAEGALAKVYDIATRLDDADRRALLLALSRRALVAGHLEFARLAGAEALKIEGMPNEDLQRGNLYAVAAALASSDPAKAASELQSIDRSLLHPADLGLLDAANSVLTHMEGPVEDGVGATEAAELASSPTLERAQKLLEAVAGDLGDKGK
ncbi:hypothetical protein GCM10011390_43880 [Aureimonas endophytica]|uniref:Chemotaxis protein MotC n=1 Tax=Aureimonas endophytica TaxID=2027858 RepID=A0A917EAU6_9HYPH|nr:hypothetical protein [Aureimonas endophytica]GGE19847.1 hypothetical protein GCM10011390_43880 [Aureimonas endophytica]